MLFEGQIHDLKFKLPWIRIRKEKSSLRAIIEQRRRIYDKDKAAADAEAIIERIERMPEFQQARTVLMFFPIHNEVDLRALMHKYMNQKTILLPVSHRRSIEIRPYIGDDNLKKGKLHVLEPQTPTYKGEIDMILVPGVVFDHHRNRIGRGGGYYDRFLRHQKNSIKVGICYDFQLRKKEIPHQFFDRKVDRVVTPTQSIG